MIIPPCKKGQDLPHAALFFAKAPIIHYTIPRPPFFCREHASCVELGPVQVIQYPQKGLPVLASVLHSTIPLQPFCVVIYAPFNINRAIGRWWSMIFLIFACGRQPLLLYRLHWAVCTSPILPPRAPGRTARSTTLRVESSLGYSLEGEPAQTPGSLNGGVRLATAHGSPDPPLPLL